MDGNDRDTMPAIHPERSPAQDTMAIMNAQARDTGLSPATSWMPLPARQDGM